MVAPSSKPARLSLPISQPFDLLVTVIATKDKGHSFAKTARDPGIQCAALLARSLPVWPLLIYQLF